MNFDNDVQLSPFFQLWDRGDGIGEISHFNCIVAYIHGPQPDYPEDYFYYDKETDSYLFNEIYNNDSKQVLPVSCFPGILTSHSDIFSPFNHLNIASSDHLLSLIHSIPSELLPDKPKGSIFDVFSQQEKFLVADFNIDIIKNGMELHSNIVDNFNHFSHHLQGYFLHYPEVTIQFLKHSYLNGNVYFLYRINHKYLLHLVFNQDNQIVLGHISLSHQMKVLSLFSCSDNSYDLICQQIVHKLKLSTIEASIVISLSEKSVDNMPRHKNIFIHELISNQLSCFISKITYSSVFIIDRNIDSNNMKNIKISIKRDLLIKIQEHACLFDMTVHDFISLLINDYFHCQI